MFIRSLLCLQYSTPSGLAYVAEQTMAAIKQKDMSPQLRHKVDHLTCFVPGMLALGAVNSAGLDWKHVGDEFMSKRLDGNVLVVCSHLLCGVCSVLLVLLR